MDYFKFPVVKEALRQRGTLDQMKGCIRAEVYKVIAEETVDQPSITSENLLIIELIKEFLEFNNYKYTASVMKAGIHALIFLPVFIVHILSYSLIP